MDPTGCLRFGYRWKPGAERPCSSSQHFPRAQTEVKGPLLASAPIALPLPRSDGEISHPFLTTPTPGRTWTGSCKAPLVPEVRVPSCVCFLGSWGCKAAMVSCGRRGAGALSQPFPVWAMVGLCGLLASQYLGRRWAGEGILFKGCRKPRQGG